MTTLRPGTRGIREGSWDVPPLAWNAATIAHRARASNGERGIPALVEGTLRQPRLLAGAPRAVEAADLDLILHDALRYW